MLFCICFLISGSLHKVFCLAIAKYISLDCHKVIIIFLAKMMYLAVTLQYNRETPHDKQEAITKKPHTRPRTHAELQGAAPQTRPQKFKRQLNRCTKPQIRGDIKQLKLLKGTMCHHLTVTCILSSTEEGDAWPCSWLSARQEDYKNAML